MITRLQIPALAGLAAIVFTGTAISAAEPGAVETAADSKAAKKAAIEANTKEVRDLLKSSADFLAAQKKFSFKAETGFNVVQSNGQSLSFFESREALLRRPDHLRVETDEADGDSRTLRFDGKQVTIDTPGENAYVLIEKPGSIDQLVAYFVDDLDIPIPLDDIYTTNFYAEMGDAIQSGFYVEEVTFGKRQCDHIALRLKEVDLEAWIETGERPLLCMVIITYKHAVGRPQYWSRFVEWDLSPAAPDSKFMFTPPKGAERLSVQTAVKEIRQDKEVK